MKKTLAFLLLLLTLINLLCVTAAATWYTGFDVRFEEKDGEKVNATKLTIMASVEDGAMIDRTNDFTLEGVEWFKYVSEPESGKTVEDYDYVDEDLHIYGMLCTDDDVFDHEHYSYFLRIARLYAEEEDTFDRNVKINGVDVEEMNGICYNTGSEFYIKTVTNGSHGAPDVEEETTLPEADTSVEPATETPGTEKKKCGVCGICPFQPLGICLFIWLAIILVILVIAIIVMIVVRKMRKDENKG